MTFLLFAASAAILLQAASHSVTYDTALWLAGISTPALAHLIKKRFNKCGPAAFYITLAVSVAIALVVGFYFGELHTLSDAFQPGATVLGTATAVFKVLKHVTDAADGAPLDPPLPPAGV